MDSLALFFYASNWSFSIELTPMTESNAKAYSELLGVFAEIDGDSAKVYRDQKMTPILLKKIKAFCSMYKTKCPILNKFERLLSSLSEGENFLLLFEQLTTTKEILTAYNYLKAVNEANTSDEIEKIFEEENIRIETLYGEILEHYELVVPIISGTSSLSHRVYIGKPTKDKRVCRFCKRTVNEGANFKKVAHAIPEALGNKRLILYEECDVCNENFADTIERDFIRYLDVHRVFWGVKGKEGIPKIKYKNAMVESHAGMTVIRMSGPPPEKTSLPLALELVSQQTLATVNIYKSLCRVALSVIPDKQLTYFDKTIKWLKSQNDDEMFEELLPKVAERIAPLEMVAFPEIRLYIRTSEHIELPHVVGEFRFKSLIFVFILPFSERDNTLFSEEKNFTKFWSTFKHHSLVDGWIFQSFSDSQRRKAKYKLNFIEGELAKMNCL